MAEILDRKLDLIVYRSSWYSRKGAVDSVDRFPMQRTEKWTLGGGKVDGRFSSSLRQLNLSALLQAVYYKQYVQHQPTW